MSRVRSSVALSAPAFGAALPRALAAVRRVAGTACVTLMWAALGCAVTLAALTAGATLIAGHPTFHVLSGSMAPALEVGSVVIDERIAPIEARPGDMVTFPDPQQRSRLITHRVKRVAVSGDTVSFVTKGDANATPERWNVSAGHEIGRVAYHAPKLGYARTWAATLGGRLGMLGLVVVWGLAVVVSIWRPRER